MPDPQTTQRLVSRLASGENPDEIIYELCETSNLSWPEAEALVRQIQADQEETIVRKQSPLTVLLALILFVAGLAMMTAGLYVIVITFEIPSHVSGPTRLISTIGYAIQSWPAAWLLILFGFSTVVGSMIGMRQTLSSLLEGVLNRLRL